MSRPTCATADGLFSGKAGVLYQAHQHAANVYLSYGSTVTPPGTANFTLSTQPNNQNNPNVDPQKSSNYEIGSKIGFYENKLSLTAAVFRTDNENVIFTVDATAIPPIFNQDDQQRVKDSPSARSGRSRRSGRCWPASGISTPGRSARTR